VRREATSLSRAGYDVTVISPAAKGQPKREIVDGVRVFRYPAPKERDGFLGYALEYGYAMLAAWVLTLYVFVRFGFDVIHAHNPPDTYVAIAAPYKLFGKRFVFDHHDLSPEMYDARFTDGSNALVRRVLEWFENLTFRFADRVISTNESYEEIAIERGGVPSERIAVVRNGPDLDRVRAVAPDPELRAKAGTIIGYVGIMGYQDGVDYLIRALAHLVTDLDRQDVLCFIVGEGGAVPSLKTLVAELGLEEHVWFTGRVSDEDLMRYLSTADICVDPDPFNPFNDRSTMIKMSEYMAVGKPIVAFDLREHRRTAEDAALYAAPNDELDYARKLEELMDDPEKRAKMGERGRRRVEDVLAWPHQEARLLEVYRGLLAVPNAPERSGEGRS
jgi:glycosyltransferase involved in cell wall biosynthesis